MNLTNRTLAVITDELRDALKHEVADIIAIGGLLLDAKAMVKHGEWLPWLKTEFSMSVRTAQNYMKAAEFAAKCVTVADSQLSPRALYRLAQDDWEDEHWRTEATTAVLKEAASRRVGYDEAQQIIDEVLSEHTKPKGADGGQRPPSPRPPFSRSGEARSRGAAAIERDTRRLEGMIQLKSYVSQIRQIVSAKYYDDRDRLMLRRDHEPCLNGFIDEKGKCLFDPSETLLATGNDDNDGSQGNERMDMDVRQEHPETPEMSEAA